MPNLRTLQKQESITFQILGSWDFWQIVNSVLNEGKSAIPPLFNSPDVLFPSSDKAKLFAKNFSKNSNLSTLVSLYLFSLLEVVSDKIARAFNRPRSVALEYPRILTEFVMLVLFTNLSLRELQVRDFTLFLLFSVIDSFGWFKMGRLQKNIQLMLIFSRLHSWSYTFPTIH